MSGGGRVEGGRVKDEEGHRLASRVILLAAKSCTTGMQRADWTHD